MNYSNNEKFIQKLLAKLYNLEDRVERLEHTAPRMFASENDLGDPLYEDVKKLVMKTRKASTALLQRELKISYARAARFLDILENDGIIGPADGAKPRDVLKDNLN